MPLLNNSAQPVRENVVTGFGWDKKVLPSQPGQLMIACLVLLRLCRSGAILASIIQYWFLKPTLSLFSSPPLLLTILRPMIDATRYWVLPSIGAPGGDQVWVGGCYCYHEAASQVDTCRCSPAHTTTSFIKGLTINEVDPNHIIIKCSGSNCILRISVSF